MVFDGFPRVFVDVPPVFLFFSVTFFFFLFSLLNEAVQCFAADLAS